jgi:hypothetical protein
VKNSCRDRLDLDQPLFRHGPLHHRNPFSAKVKTEAIAESRSILIPAQVSWMMRTPTAEDLSYNPLNQAP